MQRCVKGLAVVVMLLALVGGIGAGRILAAFQLNAHSHFAVYHPLLKELARRGHQVTVVSHFPQERPMPNYTDISLKGSLPSIVNNISFSAVEHFDVSTLVQYFWRFSLMACEVVLGSDQVQALLRSGQDFDLVITEVFSVDCMASLAHRFQAPLVNLQSSVPMPWAWDRMGNPDNPAYMPSYFSQFTDSMSFWERLQNTAFGLLYRLGFWYFEMQADALCRKYVGADTPPLAEIVRNTSLLLVNAHLSLNPPAPLVPGIVNVAGMHLRQPQPLSQDLEKFLQESPHGVLVFSLGSMMRSETMPQPLLEAFFGAFAALPQRVLWKTGRGAPPGLPRDGHVLAVDWLPQADLIYHPKVVALLTHGGLLSVLEAVDAGVPMVGLPLHSDQHANMAAMARRGAAIVLDHRTLTRDHLLQALRDVIQDSKYRENARRLSSLFRDRPRPPLQEAVYWSEYVMRHRGAPHLRSAAVHLSWWQHWLLDVIAAIFLTLTVILLLLRFVFRLLLHLLCCRPSQTEKKLKRL